MSESIKGRVALVTGASQGLGRVIALTLAKEGCKVVVNCAHSAQKAEHVAQEIRNDGGEAEVYVCDISDEKAVRTMFRELGKVDILVNNARIDPYFRKPEMSDGEWWDLVMRINLKGAYLCSQVFFDQAKERGWGRIVNIASSRSFTPAEPHMIAYGVSKLGMHGLTRAFAENGGAFGITANTVCPGMVMTENLRKRITEEDYQATCRNIPGGRGGSCEEMADGVLFAVRNGYVTGESIHINGGLYYAP